MERAEILQQIKHLNERLANLADLRATIAREEKSIHQRRAMLYAGLQDNYRRMVGGVG